MLLLRDLGIREMHIDGTQWRPEEGDIERSRPDRAEAMKATHAARAHDKWFREQVQAGLAEADDPTTQWVPHEVVKEDIARQRAALKARIEGKAK